MIAPHSIAMRSFRRFVRPTLLLIVVLAIGTAGYEIIGDNNVSALDSLYMTFITIATIGYGEIVDLSHHPGGRIFTMVIATAGIATTTYMLSSLTAFILEGDINQEMKRKRMEKRIAALSGHYIICGIGRVGSNVAQELMSTARTFVVIDTDQHNIDLFLAHHPDGLWLLGDASDDELLLKAGVMKAKGSFAVTGDDSKNLVISLTSKQLNPAARVVARCHEISYIPKIKRVGADEIVSPDFTGGMRIASSMIRPHVVNFLDEMLRSDSGLRVEEIHLPENFVSRGLAELFIDSRDYIVLAIRVGSDWVFNPESSYQLMAGQTVVVMATAKGRAGVEKLVAV